MATDDPPKPETADQSDDQLAQTQRFLAIGQLLAGVSHESRNILTAILSFAQVGQRRQNEPDKMAKILKLIESEALRCIDLHTTVLAQVATRDIAAVPTLASEPKSTSLAEVLSSTTRLVGHQMGMKRIKLETFGVASDIFVAGSRTALGQVFLNLLINAMQATPEDGRVRISISPPKDARVRIAIDDSGPGVLRELRQRVFERMFTTKVAGTGLGLAISHDIVSNVGGTLLVEDSDLGGASFAVTLPLAVPPSEV